MKGSGKFGRPAEPRRPDWIDSWLEYPHTEISTKSAREACWWILALEEELQLTRAALAKARGESQ